MQQRFLFTLLSEIQNEGKRTIWRGKRVMSYLNKTELCGIVKYASDNFIHFLEARLKTMGFFPCLQLSFREKAP